MNELDFYLDLKEKTKKFSYKPTQEVKNLSELEYLLWNALLTEDNKKALESLHNEKERADFFHQYEPKEIRRMGNYASILSRFLAPFGTENKGLYKKMVQAVVQSARYLSSYSSLEEFKKELKKITKDKESTLAYLQDFRKISSLSGMYFLKTCEFFSKSGLLDVPILHQNTKKVLMESFQLQDDNLLLYRKMVKIASDNHIAVDELNQRFDALS